jgi:hypothetical protein
LVRLDLGAGAHFHGHAEFAMLGDLVHAIHSLSRTD